MMLLKIHRFHIYRFDCKYAKHLQNMRESHAFIRHKKCVVMLKNPRISIAVSMDFKRDKYQPNKLTNSN